MSQTLIWTLLILGVCLVLVLARWQAYTQTLPAALTFEPVEPDTLPALDQSFLQNQTETLITLGFIPLEDTLLIQEKTHHPQQFHRLYWHPSHTCYARLQMPLAKRSGSLAIISLFNNNWSLYTTNTPPSVLEIIANLDRVTWSSHPQATAPELLTAHLSRRDALIAQHHLQPQSLASAEPFYIKAKEETLRRKQVIKRQNLLISLGKGIRAKLTPPNFSQG